MTQTNKMDTVIQNVWTKTRILIKALIIGGIVLILQIPTFYVQDLIKEREDRQKEAITEVSSKWATKQAITGPVLVLPFLQGSADSTNKTMTKHFAYFLPDVLNITSAVTPEEKYRGIYKVMLYTSKINLTGAFNSIPLDKLKIDPQDILWKEAFVHINISDIKGLNDDLNLHWNNQVLTMSPDVVEGSAMSDGLNGPLTLTGVDDLKHVDFSSDINLNGSQQLLFTPVGKSTSVEMSAKWPHPSFAGDILPSSSSISNDSFQAKWKSIAQKRSFPQQWKDNAFTISSTTKTSTASANDISENAFGADLYVPVNGYQKTMRSVKYSFLCILLTFAAFFLIDTTNRKSVHPFQYGLVGLALVLFYTLLLSISEYIGFTYSYAVAAVATIGLIAWFVKGVLGSMRLTTILSVVLLFVYTYMFTILQLQDYALLLGSIGLFLALAVIMQFSKRVEW
jgi:inner membrane protein